MNAMDTSTPLSLQEVLARKAEGRRELAALTFLEKLEILEAMRMRVEPIRQARENRRKTGPVLPPA
jgi:hypothetical protein